MNDIAMMNNKASTLTEANKVLWRKIKNFEPSGFFQVIKHYLFGREGFQEIQDYRQEIKENTLKIADLKLSILLSTIQTYESRYIQRKDLEVVASLREKLLHYLSLLTYDLTKKLTNKLNEINSKFSSLGARNSILVEEKDNYSAWREQSNKVFIANEERTFHEYFQHVESQPLTPRQMLAVITNEESNLILAGAGSGKTSVIVAKIGYILKKGYASESEILILAFNKKAQEELSERILEKLKVKVDTKTFHSFGLKVIAKARGVKPSLCKWAEDDKELPKFVDEIIRKKMNDDSTFYEAFTEYFVSYFTEYKSHEDFENLGEYYAYIKNNAIRTFKDELVKSYEECEIANQLFMWGVEYKYEEKYQHNTASTQYRQYVPDFYLPQYDIYIEHFGIGRDGSTAPFVNAANYNADREWKLNLHEEAGTQLIETFSYEKKEGNLLSNLKEKLEAHDITINPISTEEALKVFNELSLTNRFSKLIVTFMGHYQSNQFTIADLRAKSGVDKRAHSFLYIFNEINNEIQKEKKSLECIDFDDMIIEAVNAVEQKLYRSNYKYILVDEFQDISTGRSRLITAIRKQVSNSNVTVVGDDWQSINRFAGSDISIILNFEKIFGNSETVHLDYTFRFNNKISETATKFVTKNPKQIKKEIKTINETDKPSLYLYWYQNSREMDKYVKQLIALIAKNDNEGKDKSIKILGRYGFNKPENLSALKREYRDRFNITFSTVHGSKGLEADYIILVGLESGQYGFPSEIMDDVLLDLVIPQNDSFKNAEERRLFYVALTRAKRKVFITANMYQKSFFVKELLEDNKENIFELNYSSDDVETCTECKTGSMIKRENKSKGERHWFYGCSNYPLCKHTEKVMICPTCKKHEVKKDLKARKAFCRDKACKGYIKLCTRCNSFLVLRNGKNGNFLGCDSFPKCQYTESMIKQ